MSKQQSLEAATVTLAAEREQRAAKCKARAKRVRELMLDEGCSRKEAEALADFER
jgi:hypothetical protein